MQTLRSLAAATATAVVLGACSAGSPTSSAGSPAAATAAGPAGADNVALYDDSRVHDIDVTFDAAAYDELVAAYASSRDKDWIEATVTIDGVTIDRVGMRLKGN